MAKPGDDGGPGDASGGWTEADSTVRLLVAAVDPAVAALLRGAPPLDAQETLRPPQGVEPSEAPRADTPKTLVVSAVVRADRGTLTVIVGPEAGAIFSLAEEELVVGRDTVASIAVRDPSVSRLHARITNDGHANYVIEDLGSTNGTFVNGRRVRRAALRTGDRVQLGRDSVFRFAVVGSEEEELQRRLYGASMRDGLTDLPNRRALVERLAGEVRHARGTRTDLALLMMDVDHFKEVNDQLGHLVGDEALREVARVAQRELSTLHLIARYGGEEFVVLAREADKIEATALAERVRRAIMETRVDVHGTPLSVTVSIGVSALSECGLADDGTELISLADARLYAAKLQGRNRTCDEG